MTYEEIKQKEGLEIAVNQALIDFKADKITGGDFLDILFELHPIQNTNTRVDKYFNRDYFDRLHNDYEEFMKKYRTTLTGFIFDHENKDEYKDLNDCICNCGDKHVFHDRISENEFKNCL